MARQQVGYNPGAEALRPTVSPNYQMIQPQSVESILSENKGFQLASALGSPSTQKALEQFAASKEEADKVAGQAYANSKTVDELKAEIESGELAASKSPVFNATVQHIYGENTQSKFERDTISKLNTGELKFDDPAQLEEYLVNGRNEYLKGADKFAIAGFDKRFGQFREAAQTAHAKMKDAEAVDRGVSEAQDNLWTITQQVQDPTFKGTKEEAAAQILERYQLLTASSLLRDDQRKGALQGVMAQMVSTGDIALVDAMLASKLDNGLTVGSILGGSAVTTLKSSVVSFDNKVQHERINTEILPYLKLADAGDLKGKKAEEFESWYFNNKKYVTPSTYMSITNSQQAAEARAQAVAQKALILAKAEETVNVAQQNTVATIEQGGYAFLPQQKIMTTTGDITDFKQKEFATDYIQRRVNETQMPFDKQVQFWSTNGLQNPQWEKTVQSGVSNLASVGWTYDGKNVGQINPQGEAALNQYIQIAAVNPAEADKYAGKDADLLSDIKFMVEKGGMPNISDAAKFVNQVRTRGIKTTDIGSMKESVKSAVDSIVNPSWYSSTANYIGSYFGGNQDVNLTAIQADIRRRSELLVLSGQVPDAQAAVRATVEYFSNPAITSKINNTVYFNKDLPTVPKNESQVEWMERFIEQVPGKIANDQKLDGSRIRLEPDQSGSFTAWAGNVPLTDSSGKIVSYTKGQISQWVGSQHNTELIKKVTVPKSGQATGFDKSGKPTTTNFKTPLATKPKKDQSRVPQEITNDDLKALDFIPNK